jgi:osmotically-inducible protein OsmY
MRVKFLFALFIAFALGMPPVALGQMRDTDLAERVAETIRHYVSFSIFDDVNVAVSDRAVTLTGRVTMPFKRDDIGKRVARIDGIRSLANNIEVLPVSRTDAELRTRIAQAIYGHPAFWQDATMVNPPIHIVIERGHVTLTGCVNNQVERALAFALAQVDGVLSVKNQLRIDKG